MQKSLRLFKRLLLSVVFITSNSVYATDQLGNGGSYTQGQPAQTGQPAETVTTSNPPRAILAPDSAEVPVGSVISNPEGNLTSAGRANLSERGMVVTSDKSGINCATSPNPAAKDDDANKADCNSSDAIARAVSQVVSLGTEKSGPINKAHTTFTEKWKSCTKVQGTAANACLENLSPAISGASGPIGLLAAAGSGASSATGSCDTVSKIMDIANKALTLYNTACSAAKASCALSCNGAVSALEEIDKLNSSDKCLNNPACSTHPQAQATLKQALGKELNPESTLSMAGKKKLCKGKYVELGISALGGIAAVAMAMGQSDKCEEETQAAALDCTKPEQASTPTCLCQANPRLQGCANGLQKVGDAAGVGGINNTSAAKAASDDSGPVIPGSGGLDIERDPAAASSSGMPASGGGGSGLGGNGLSGNSANAAGGKGRAGFDTNILGGSSGGGGGGGWGKGFSAGSSNSKLGAYLPGGAKDPNMNGNGGSNEVTGQGGKSNWEKVRDRYRDNKTSLLNN